MAETGDTYEGPATGDHHGTYNIPSDQTVTSGGTTVYNYGYQDNFNSFLEGSTSKAWHMAHAFSDGDTCKCTDITLEQGRNNISNTVVPTGYSLDPLPSAPENNINYWEAGDSTHQTLTKEEKH